MIGWIIWLVGLVLTVITALEILNMNGQMAKKLLFVVLIVLTSWLGLVFYYFYARTNMPTWVK